MNECRFVFFKSPCTKQERVTGKARYELMNKWRSKKILKLREERTTEEVEGYIRNESQAAMRLYKNCTRDQTNDTAVVHATTQSKGISIA